MQRRIYIVKYCTDDGTSIENSTTKIIEDSKLKDVTKTRNGVFGKIEIKLWEDDGDSYSTSLQPVRVEHTFVVITSGEFIRNSNDHSALNAYTISAGFNQVNRLAFVWSATIIEVDGSRSLWESNMIWTDSGIRATTFDMYSYHVNQPEQEYTEDRLEWEVWQSLDLETLLSSYLQVSDLRDAKLDKLGL